MALHKVVASPIATSIKADTVAGGSARIIHTVLLLVCAYALCRSALVCLTAFSAPDAAALHGPHVLNVTQAWLRHYSRLATPWAARDASSTSTAYTQDVLRRIRATTGWARNQPEYFQQLQDASNKTINIAVMNDLWWELPPNSTQGCQVEGIPLDCHVQFGGSEGFLNKADALYYHLPTFSGSPRAKSFPTQLRLALSLEGSSVTPRVADPRYMCQFDAEMSFRTCAQVTSWYGLDRFKDLFKTKAVPFEDKLHAIAYINRNCNAESGRTEIMQALMKLCSKLKVEVHSLGNCDRNKPWPQGNPEKTDVMRRYKFCVAMENSVRQDYVTEKIWDALAAGCIPVYLGFGNASDFVPDPDSYILYDASGKTGHASTPEQLDAVMHEIGSNKTRYEAMLAWKQRKPEDQPNELFRYLWSVQHTTMECNLCRFLARHRAYPQPEYTTCLFNKEWMAAAGLPYTPKEQACPSPSS